MAQKRYLVMVDVLNTGTTNFYILFAASPDDAERQALNSLPMKIEDINVHAEVMNTDAWNFMRDLTRVLDAGWEIRRRSPLWKKAEPPMPEPEQESESDMPVRTPAQWAQLALDIQDACNMGGVARSFHEVVQFLHRTRDRMTQGTDWVNQHPIVKLFADKIVDLARARGRESFSEAYTACKRMIEEG